MSQAAEFVTPQYGRSTLADVLPAIAAHLLPDPARALGGDPAVDVLSLPVAKRYVVLLIDGLGWTQLRAELPGLDYFPQLWGDAIELTCSVPATTATSLTTLGTGLAPGQHGIVGYSFREEPSRHKVLNALAWDSDVDPCGYQPQATWFERLSSAGVSVTSVAPTRFEASGLTLAGLRGATQVGVDDDNDLGSRVRLTAHAVATGDRSLVYLYERSLDHAGHSSGRNSRAWRQVLERLDGYVEQLRMALPADVCLLITGDHGMVDVPITRQILLEDTAGLTRGVEVVAGEGRLRQLYTAHPDAVIVRWQRAMGERAVVLSAEQAIDQGWFGAVSGAVRPRIGDVLVAMRDNWAMMTRALPRELTLVGQHGSLTPDEMRVPLLVDPAPEAAPVALASSRCN